MNPAEVSPEISVIMPVYNGAAFLDRSLMSLTRQTLFGWELLAVDDGSSDHSYDLLRQYQSADPRIRPFHLPENRGMSAARNQALRQARGRMITYLDCDDEYYPAYLEWVNTFQCQAEVLVFAYDQVVADPNRPGHERISTWNPALKREHLLKQNFSVPLGVAHHRALLERVGMFNEDAYYEEDWDLWKRFALAGARFLFFSCPNGRYYIRPDSQSRTRRVPQVARDRTKADGAGS